MRGRRWREWFGRGVARVALALALATGMLAATWTTVPSPVFACRCVGFERFADVADPQHLVVAGTAIARGDGTLTIGVERWLWGGTREPVLVVDEPAANDQCQLAANAALGSRWLWVAVRTEFGPPIVNMCQPSWPLDGPEGLAMLDAAIDTFGGVPIGQAADPADGSAIAPAVDGSLAPVIIVGVVGVGVGVLAIAMSLAATARRRRDR